ncbi:Molybdate-binding periplasmic protein precursor [uncultured Clostridium sp.]|nr:Molybdate-binding periplasmic protein precursor [uncultured Clostridium sp.]
MMRKKVIAGLLAGALAVSMLGCGSKQAEEIPAAEETTGAEDTAAGETAEADPVTLNVFAAASMTETLTEIQEMYKEVAPNVTLVFNFDSSGTLKTQIQEGADCDVFISAAQKQMNQLDKDADPEVNTDGLDYVLEGTRMNLLENKVVLAVPDGNPKNIESFADLGTDKLSLLALGNEDVPVGQYSNEILTNLGILDSLEAAGKITYGSNVKEVTTQVSEAAADAGIIYATDAFSAKLTVVDQAGSDLCKQVIYPAAVLNVSKNQEAAKEFLAYLQTDTCMKVFEAVGFAAAE